MTLAVLIATATAALASLATAVLARARAPAPVPAVPVAALAAVLGLITAWRWLDGELPSWWLPVPLAVGALGAPLAAADLRHRRLPDTLTLPAYPILAVALSTAALTGPGLGLLVRALVAAMAFGGLHLLIHALSRRSLGAGDVKLSGALGAVLGAVSWAAPVLAAVLAALTTAVLAVVRRWERGVPHGPGLLIATWLLALFPETGMGA
ncbi:prepilin peptidase [Amycolatopsis pithecellobii]|uniref:Prepilin peptidase n=1 Tax=Amycolatopsis pithecellobii TaxID=664692 RepID=A0A6N7Z5M2_9PSEU|nr:prepilin peptidase [Amycolatopsis pithecellobii]